MSGWFNSLRRGAKGRRKDSAGTISTAPSVPLYGSLGRKKPSSGCQSKARSAWDLTTISRLVRYVIYTHVLELVLNYCLFCPILGLI